MTENNQMYDYKSDSEYDDSGDELEHDKMINGVCTARRKLTTDIMTKMNETIILIKIYESINKDCSLNTFKLLTQISDIYLELINRRVTDGIKELSCNSGYSYIKFVHNQKIGSIHKVIIDDIIKYKNDCYCQIDIAMEVLEKLVHCDSS